MSTDNDDVPKRPRPHVTEEAFGNNEMSRVKRRTVTLLLRGASEDDIQEVEHLHDSDSADMPFESRLIRDLAAIEARLDELDLPPPRGWVEVGKDHSWAPVPEDESARMVVGRGTMAEIHDPEASVWIETSVNYIKRRAKAYSLPWWLGHLGEHIICILDESDPDKHRTFILIYGSERQQYLDQQGHLVDVQRGANRVESLRDNSEQRMDAAAPWQQRARSLADEMWVQNPKRTVSNLAKTIYKRFKREAETVRADLLEQWSPIRDNDHKERLERTIISELNFRCLLSADGKDIPSEHRIRNYLNPLHPRHRQEG